MKNKNLIKNKHFMKTVSIVSCIVLLITGIIVASAFDDDQNYGISSLSKAPLTYNTEKMIYLSDVDYMEDLSYVKNGYKSSI